MHIHTLVNLDVDTMLSRVKRALSAIRSGEFVVVTDGADRENEGDLIIAAEKATPEKIAFMVNETSGLICVGVEAARLNDLKLPQMVVQNTESHATAFTVS
jgi:3,4-dihydroxy 2-butanone 4-phosphate synthase/GTP cyclohydrolase II